MPIWHGNHWQIQGKDVWGKELWKDIWEWSRQTNLSVFHVDAHASVGTLECEYNTHADHLAKIPSLQNKQDT